MRKSAKMSALMPADVRRLPRTSLRTTADLHMEILRTSAQKKLPACVDLRTKRPSTLQTSAGKCPQFSMRNITFFADISGTGSISDTYTRSYYYIFSDFSPGKLLHKVSGNFCLIINYHREKVSNTCARSVFHI